MFAWSDVTGPSGPIVSHQLLEPLVPQGWISGVSVVRKMNNRESSVKLELPSRFLRDGVGNRLLQPVPESPGAYFNNNLITPSSRVGGNRLFGPLLGNNNRGAAARAREIIYSHWRRPGAPPRPEARSAAPSARAGTSL